MKKEYIKEEAINIVVLLVLAGVVVFAGLVNPKSNSLSNFCKPSGITNGTDTFSLHVSRTSNYRFWIHLETPIQISFNDLPGTYNPLLVAVDNKACYMVGGNQDIVLNTWTWINDVHSNSNEPFNIRLGRGNHVFSITASYMSIDRVELVSGSCVPINMGTNCSSQN